MARKCGDCQLCCTLLPVENITKGGERCQFQRFHKGCSLYPNHPLDCQLWTCRWLTESDVAGISRPDRVGYVIDCLYTMLVNEENGNTKSTPAVQIWVDPKRPDAERDPALRAFIARKAQEGYPTLIRLSAELGYIVLAPPLEPEWTETEPMLSKDAEEALTLPEDLLKLALLNASLLEK